MPAIDAAQPAPTDAPHLFLTPGQTATIPVHIGFDSQPWPWHATDLMLSTVGQIIPVLLIAVSGLAFFARRRNPSTTAWFWIITLVTLALIAAEAVVLYQMGLIEDDRASMASIFIAVFAVPTVVSVGLLRAALWPKKRDKHKGAPRLAVDLTQRLGALSDRRLSEAAAPDRSSPRGVSETSRTPSCRGLERSTHEPTAGRQAALRPVTERRRRPTCATEAGT
ncbi:hypothetical protein GCM10025867_29950 [Frondihabitans sucicola]|uniref:Uncharacterized protein n=1 Tax=Frondihabitans sucicola TaxID=1268041 RepID=A0ABN6Y0X4_9MICO|nr:hypothetical protein GCM10025867_29950 [Frondihabitans sucicola]